MVITAILLVLGLQGALSQSGWGDPPFVEPGDNPANSKVSKDDTNIEITIDEDKSNVIIADLNYTGSEPSITNICSGDCGYEDLDPTIDATGDGKYHLRINGKLDFEGTASTNFKIDNWFLTIISRDVNDKPPQITAHTGCEVSEGEMGMGNTTCSIEISDEDSNDELTVKVYYGDDISENFEIKGCTKACEQNLTVIKELDYEEVPMYQLTLIVSDSIFNASTSMFVKVVDEPDMIPYWKTISPMETVDEETQANFTYIALDGDREQNATIMYKVEVDDGDERVEFNIESNDGIGTLIVPSIDVDQIQKYIFTLTLTAYEENDEDSKLSQSITIIVNDLDDMTPVITLEPPKLPLLEGSASITLTNFSVRDPDSGANGTFNVSIKDDDNKWQGAFAVVPSIGFQTANFILSIIKPDLLDYENNDWKLIELEIVAIEIFNDSKSDSTTFQIELTNKNDESPVFDEIEFEATVLENVIENTPVFSFKAFDRDVDDTISCSIQPSRDILSCTPEIIQESPPIYNFVLSVTKNDSFDFESRPLEMFQIIISDDKEGGHSNVTQFNLNIKDVNDVPPRLSMTTPERINEDVEVPFTVKTSISATDDDSISKLEFGINWENSKAYKQGTIVTDKTKYEGFFEISTSCEEHVHSRHRNEEHAHSQHRNTCDGVKAIGTLKAVKKLNWSVFDSLELIIAISDNDADPVQEVEGSLIITIEDVNDNAPAFVTTEDYPFKVVENSSPGTLIDYVVAKDDDGPDNNNIAFSLRAITDGADDLVQIDPSTGTLTVTGNIDCELFPQLQYTVTANDSVNTSELNITISVTDVNDEIPHVTTTTLTASIDESSPTSTHVLTIEAEDKDVTPNYRNLVFTLEAPFFRIETIDSSKGKITVQTTNPEKDLDIDNGGPFEYVLNVNISDNNQSPNSNVITVQVKVVLDDINDCWPILSEQNGAFLTALREDCNSTCEPGILIYEGLESTDKDTKEENRHTSYELTGIWDDQYVNIFTNEEDPLFSIKKGESGNTKTSTVDIYVNRNLTDYCSLEYTLEIKACDEDNGKCDIKNYTISIISVNNYEPEFQYPNATDNEVSISDMQKEGILLLGTQQTPISDFIADDADCLYNEINYIVRDHGSDQSQCFTLVQGDKGGRKLASKCNFQEVTLSNPVQLDIVAVDNDPDALSATALFSVTIISSTDKEPTFENCPEQNPLTYEEGKMNDTVISFCTAIDNDINSMSIYYYLVGDNKEYFKIPNPEEPQMVLAQELDFETLSLFNVTIRTSNWNENDMPEATHSSILAVMVEVIDVNDEPPMFTEDFYLGGVDVKDKQSAVVLEVDAKDEDANDLVTFDIKEGSLKAYGDSLQNFKDPFIQEPAGTFIVNFSPDESLSGYFEFVINAMDKCAVGTAGEKCDDKKIHTTSVNCSVYIITEDHLVTFTFQNPRSEVEAMKQEILEIFSKNIGYDCNLHGTTEMDEDTTKFETYFVDMNRNVPVGGKVIEDKASDILIWYALIGDFSAVNLTITKLETKAAEAENQEELLRTVLIVVSVVMGVLLLILVAVFFIKFKSLNKRLIAMSTTKFGSQDSGLNRIGAAVPNTNLHAVEGSNPIWGNEAIKDFDAASEASGDSDLIGIEDNPEFSPGKKFEGNYQQDMFTPNNDIMQERRASRNPLADMGHDEAYVSSRDTPEQDSVADDDDDDEEEEEEDEEEDDDREINSNFTFGKSEPQTEL